MSKQTQSDPSGFETLEAFSHTHAFNHWLYQKISIYVHGKTLEIGSGIGNISAFILKDQNQVSLSDLRPEYCHILQNKFGHDPHLQGVYELDLSLNDFNSEYPELLEKFDTVIALNVIEHITDDLLAIRNAKALLKNKGKLIILVPAGQWLYNSIDRELGHFRRYSKSGLNYLIETAGLEVTDCRYFNAAAIFGWWFSGNILHDKIIPPSKLKLYNHMIPLFKMVDWFVTPFTGISVISTAMKKING
jgi:2-polyprenyl-3-methyl-5-hydroxy-6-metoxy-1,4-benzoquinol methylase